MMRASFAFVLKLCIAVSVGSDGVEAQVPAPTVVDGILTRAEELPAGLDWIGGFSALRRIPDPEMRRWLLLSDRGWVAEVRVDRAIVAVPAGRVPTGSGRGRDSEAFVSDGSGGYWLSFERDHRLHRVDGALSTPPEEIVRPIGAVTMPSNGGIEAIARLDDGRLLALGEAPLPGTDLHPAWLGDPMADLSQRTYYSGNGYRPVDAVFWPGVGVLVLERRLTLLFLGFGSRLSVVPLAALDGPDPITAVPVLFLNRHLPNANWEGLDLEALPDGGCRLTMVSDDNFDARIPSRIAWMSIPDCLERFDPEGGQEGLSAQQGDFR